MYFWDLLVKVDSFPVRLRDSCKNNHFFILYRYKIFKMDVQKWLQTREGMLESSAAFMNARAWFAGRLPNADQTKFVAKVVGYKNRQISGAQIYYKKGMQKMDKRNERRSWPAGLSGEARNDDHKSGAHAGRSYQLSLRQTKTSLPIPAVNFTEAAPSP